MKRLLTFLLTLGLLFALSSPVFASSDVKINANGNILKDAQAVIQNGSTLLPVRSVSNAFGCEVNWDGDTKTVSVNKDATQITIVIGQKELTVNDTKQAISAPAQIINGRTYVPLRALGEALDCEIQWVNDTRTVEITPNDPAEYKAWYEVDENGMLQLKTNINSRKWDGYSALIVFNMKNRNNNNHYECDSQSGKGIIEYQCTSMLSYPWTNEVSGVKSTELYIFKGTASREEFWRLNDKLGDRKKALDAMSNKIIYQTTISNPITFKEINQPIAFKNFAITYNKAAETETYTAFIDNKIASIGEYGLCCEGTKNHHSFSYIAKNVDHLSFTREVYHFAPTGSKNTFYITYCVHSIDNVGNILCQKAISNGLEYQIP